MYTAVRSSRCHVTQTMLERRNETENAWKTCIVKKEKKLLKSSIRTNDREERQKKGSYESNTCVQQRQKVCPRTHSYTLNLVSVNQAELSIFCLLDFTHTAAASKHHVSFNATNAAFFLHHISNRNLQFLSLFFFFFQEVWLFWFEVNSEHRLIVWQWQTDFRKLNGLVQQRRHVFLPVSMSRTQYNDSILQAKRKLLFKKSIKLGPVLDKPLWPMCIFHGNILSISRLNFLQYSPPPQPGSQAQKLQTFIDKAYRWFSITWFGSGNKFGSHYKRKQEP